MEILDLNFTAGEAARILGVRSLNVVSVWANRKLVRPNKIINLSSKKRIFEFSFVNLFQLAILKEMGDYFLIQYEFLNKLTNEKSGFKSEQLERAIKKGKGFIVISSFNLPRERLDIIVSEWKKVQSIEVMIVENQEDVIKCIAGRRYVLVLNIEEIIRHLIERINEFR